MEDIGRVDVLESSQYLVHKVADVVGTEPLGLEQFVQVCLHQCLHHVSTSGSRIDTHTHTHTHTHTAE